MQTQDPSKKQYRGLVQATGQIFKNEGVKGLYSAWAPVSMRAAIIAMSEIATYDEIKTIIIRQGYADGNGVQLTSSLCSGVISTFFAAPMDFLKTRMQSQPVNSAGQGLYWRNTWDCAIQSVRTSSVSHLWTGVVPHYLRRGPHLVITFMTMEKLRFFFGGS